MKPNMSHISTREPPGNVSLRAREQEVSPRSRSSPKGLGSVIAEATSPKPCSGVQRGDQIANLRKQGSGTRPSQTFHPPSRRSTRSSHRRNPKTRERVVATHQVTRPVSDQETNSVGRALGQHQPNRSKPYLLIKSTISQEMGRNAPSRAKPWRSRTRSRLKPREAKLSFRAVLKRGDLIANGKANSASVTKPSVFKEGSIQTSHPTVHSSVLIKGGLPFTSPPLDRPISTSRSSRSPSWSSQAFFFLEVQDFAGCPSVRQTWQAWSILQLSLLQPPLL
jgi:hypothetical protein